MNLLHTAEDAVAAAVPQTRLVKPIAIGLLVLLIPAGLPRPARSPRAHPC